MKRLAFTMTRGAFTMAEILLSLTIIGVVAAITLPSLTGNINERTWNTQRKALYARFSQAFALMPALNGFGTVSEAVGTEGEEGYVAAVDNAAETFVTAGLSKVMKINNICSDNLEDCGVPMSFNTMGASQMELPTTLQGVHEMFSSGERLDTKAAAFETANGESIVVYYNPTCKDDQDLDITYVSDRMCANFVYDLNGTKGPNTVGKDIGIMSVFFPADSVVVAPMPSSTSNAASQVDDKDEALSACRAQLEDSRIPNLEEASSMVVNRSLIDLVSGGESYFWTSTVRYKAGHSVGNVFVYTSDGMIDTYWENGLADVRCVNR